MQAYITTPKSRMRIRKFANAIRETFRIETIRLDVTKVLEVYMPKVGIEYKIICDTEWEKLNGNSMYGKYNINDKLIELPQGIYLKACNDDGFSRFTIIHEIGHALMLHGSNVALFRSLNGEKVPAFKDPEWQANCFAGELLMPYVHCKDMTVPQIMKNCGVTRKAAETQKSAWSKQ